MMKQMKKSSWLLAAFLFCGISQHAFSQTLKDFFSSSETAVTYLGIDFTKARLINYPNPNAVDIKERIYGAMNDLVLNEPKKYDLAGAFHKSNITNDLTAVRMANQKINSEEIVSSNSGDFSRLKESDLAAMVKALDLNGKKGIGILFVMEGMKKDDKKGEASMYAVLLDMSTKKILLSERFESKAAGFGFRNYWTSTVKETLDEIEHKKYKDWKSKFGS